MRKVVPLCPACQFCSHNRTCAQVGYKCGLTSALIGQKSALELPPNLGGGVSVFIPKLGIILPIYYERYKLASSVNLYRFTHFLDFPFGAIFANLLVGEASPIPFDRYLRYRLLVHSERFPEKEKTWTAIWHPG